MPKITGEETSQLEKLKEKSLSGESMTDKEFQALEQAEEAGLIEGRGVGEKVLSTLKGERGMENLKDVGGFGAEIGGSIAGIKAGALAGARLPLPPPLRVLTSLTGAGIGAMGGNVLKQLGIEGKEELNTTETGLAGVLEFILPGAGKLAQAGFKSGSKLINKLSGADETPTSFKSSRAEDLATETRKAGVTVPLASVFEGKLLSTLDSLASKSLTGSGTMKKQGQKVQDFLEERIDKFASKFRTDATPMEVSKQIQRAIKGDVQVFNDLRNKLYGRLDLASFQREGAKVDLEFMAKGRVSFKEAAKILQESTGSKLTPKIKSEMLKSARRLDSAPPPTQAQKARFSENSALAEELAEIEGRATLDSSVTFVDDLKIAFDLTEKMGEKFNQTLLKEIAESKPEQLLDLLFNTGKSDTIAAVMKMKDIHGKALLSEDTKNGIRAVFLGLKGEGGGLLGKATKSVDGVDRIDGKKLLSEIAKFEGRIGKGVSQALFPGTGLEGVKRFGEMLQILQGSRGEGAGAMALFLQTPGAVASVAVTVAGAVAGEDIFNTTTGLGLAGAGVILLGPMALAKMLTNPKTFEKFAKGFEKRMSRPDDLMFYLTTIAAQMAKEGDDVRVLDQRETEDLIKGQRQVQLRETQRGLLETLANSPI